MYDYTKSLLSGGTEVAKANEDISEILSAAKSAKTETLRNKAASAKLLISTTKLNKSVETLFVKSKTKADSAIEDLKKSFTTRSRKLKTEMEDDRKSVETVKKDAKREYNKFKRTYNAATNSKDGIAAKHDKVVSLHTNAARLHNEISKNATSARNTEGQIQDLHKSAKKNESQIVDANTRAKTLGQEIEDTYSIVVDTTLAGTLVTRRDDLKPTVKRWERMYIVSLFIISLAVILALTVDRPSTLIQVLTERLVFITPLVVVAFVASRQFSQERKLLEEYAFKAATAQSLKGYTLLLNEQFKDMPEARKEILQFTIGAMQNIYDRQPLENRSSKYHFIAGNKMARIEAKIEEIQHEVQQKAKITQKTTIE